MKKPAGALSEAVLPVQYLVPATAQKRVVPAAKRAASLLTPRVVTGCTDAAVIEAARTFLPEVDKSLGMSPIRESTQRGLILWQVFKTGTKRAVVQVTAMKFGNPEVARHVIKVLQLLHANGASRQRLTEVKRLMFLALPQGEDVDLKAD